MEILITKGVTTFMTKSFSRTKYSVYSTQELNQVSIKSLLRSIDAGQDIDIKMSPIDGLTAYKFKYACELSCDSGD